jgi:hypothetical protein
MRRYDIVVDGAGSNLAACFADLPGCIAADEIEEKVARLIREAI